MRKFRVIVAVQLFMRRIIVKRIFTAAIILLIIIFLTGCSSERITKKGGAFMAI
jgi:hypothetical protein